MKEEKKEVKKVTPKNDNFVYKNVSGQDLMIPDLGIIKTGDIIEIEYKINNTNFKLVK